MLLFTVLFPAVIGTAVSGLARGQRRPICLSVPVLILLTDLLGILAIRLGKPLTLLDLGGNVTLSLFADGIGKCRASSLHGRGLLFSVLF